MNEMNEIPVTEIIQQTTNAVKSLIGDIQRIREAILVPEQIDKIVCDWSMKFKIAMSEEAQIELVLALCSPAKDKLN